MSGEFVTLSTLGGGVAEELFGVELERVIDNILDPNADPKKARTITLKIKIKPGQSDPAACTAEITCSSTIAPSAPFETMLVVGQDGDRAAASEVVQQSIFGEQVDQKTGEIVAIAGGSK